MLLPSRNLCDGQGAPDHLAVLDSSQESPPLESLGETLWTRRISYLT